MSKNIVPCGGFELGDSLVINDGKLDLAPGAGGVTVDSELSDTSENPVQNKVIKAALGALRFDVPVYFDLMTRTVSCPVSVSDIVEKVMAGFYPVAILTGAYGGQSSILGYSIGFVNKGEEVVFYFFDSMTQMEKDGVTYPLAIQTVIISDSGATLSPTEETLIEGLMLSGQNGIIMPSSTLGSSKKFKITVNDSDAITATEVTT